MKDRAGDSGGASDHALSRKEKLDMFIAKSAAVKRKSSTSLSRMSVGGSPVPQTIAREEGNQDGGGGGGGGGGGSGGGSGGDTFRAPLRTNPGGGAEASVGAGAEVRRLSARDREENLKARLAAYQKRKLLAAAARSNPQVIVPQEKENDDRAHREVK